MKKKEKEKEEIKEKLENKIKKDVNGKKEKNDILNLVFEPPKIEGGKYTQEEFNNLKGDEDTFLQKDPKEIEKDVETFLNNKLVEKTEIEIAKHIIDELDEDRLDIQYYEGVKFPEEEEQGELNDNAYMEYEEKQYNNYENERKNDKKQDIQKENEIKSEKL